MHERTPISNLNYFQVNNKSLMKYLHEHCEMLTNDRNVAGARGWVRRCLRASRHRGMKGGIASDDGEKKTHTGRGKKGNEHFKWSRTFSRC